MAKSSEKLNDQVEAVNDELRRLKLQEVTSYAEKALVDSAYDQMGTSNLLQQLSALIPALIAFFTVFLTGGISWVALVVGMIIGLVALLFFYFPLIMPAQQTAKAVELIIMYRAAQPAIGKTEP